MAEISVDRTRLLALTEKLMLAHAPPGAEGEVEAIVKAEIGPFGDGVWQDASGGIVIHIRGKSDSAPIAVTAHMDEIAMIVKRVEENGRLRVRPLGGLHPWAVGEGPVEVLGNAEPVPGILSVGSKHVSDESPAGPLKTGAPLKWETFWVETKCTPDALLAQGVHVGSKVVLARSRKVAMPLGDCLCGYNLDCRAGLAMLLEAVRYLKEHQPPQDVYLIASSEEEIGAQGAVYSIGQVPADTAVALDIAPVAPEYQTKNTGDPILLYADAQGVYHERSLKHLESLAAGLGFGTQPAVVTSYGSDASIAKKAGAAGRSICIAYPGENTHGYEICSVDGLVNTARLLIAYLMDPGA
ncbi:MAG: M20/M25/M40 family metallo-hydrolase [bacterium]|nr:M20/M25/M40 family metallo-hydrolase [bacterium]